MNRKLCKARDALIFQINEARALSGRDNWRLNDAQCLDIENAIKWIHEAAVEEAMERIRTRSY